MATGTVKWFNQALLNVGKKQFDLTADVLKIGIVTATTVPALTTPDPRWGSGGTTDFSTTQVSTTAGYTGPITLTGVTWTLVSGVPTLRADNVSIAQNASGFSNGAYGIIYNDTAAGKPAIGYIELSSAGSAGIVSGALNIDWSGATNDILTLTAS